MLMQSGRGSADQSSAACIGPKYYKSLPERAVAKRSGCFGAYQPGHHTSAVGINPFRSRSRMSAISSSSGRRVAAIAGHVVAPAAVAAAEQPVETVRVVPSSIGADNDHPYMSGLFAPNLAKVTAPSLRVLDGAVPHDISGVYIRNTEQPTHEPRGGNYHPFDGDAMLHQVEFEAGICSYRNRFVETTGFLEEQQAGEALWVGVSERKEKSMPGSLRPDGRLGWGAEGVLKDTSSTDVVVHAGKVLTMFYRCGEAYRLDPLTLENLGAEQDWTLPLSAHAKVDELSGELLFFNYGTEPGAFMNYGVVGKDNQLKHYVPIPLSAPKLPHDMCFTEHYSILCDLATQFDEKALAQDPPQFRNRTSKVAICIQIDESCLVMMGFVLKILI